MQYKTVAASLLASAAIVSAEDTSSTWTTLTPNATYHGAATDYVSSFGIAVQPITSGISSLSTSATAQATATSTEASSASSSATTTLSPSSSAVVEIDSVSCKNEGTLEMSLNGSVLVDNKGRVGSIVANRQFQFDGPPPQAGAIYAAGWSITPEGNLAIGDNDVFYQCLSGTFYNLYDESIGGQCKPIHLEVVGLVDC